MTIEVRIEVLKGKISLLNWLLNYDCNCPKSDMSQYVHEMKSLKYEYETELNEISSGNTEV